MRIAHTWLDEPSLRIFYKAHGMKYEQGRIPDDVGDISGMNMNRVRMMNRSIEVERRITM